MGAVPATKTWWPARTTREYPTTSAQGALVETRLRSISILLPVVISLALMDRGIELKLWVVLARAYAAVSERAARDVARHELTLAEFAVMEALYHKGPLLLGEVQKKILVSSGGVTYLVDRLEQRGLVERQPCLSDRRARYAALTAEGKSLMVRIFPEHAECILE